MQQGLEDIPGVEVAGATFGVPLSGTNFSISFSVEGRPAPDPGSKPDAQLRLATPGFFTAMEIPVVRGRGFTSYDRDGAPITLLVSEELARRYFPNEEVIGQRLTFGWSRDSMDLAGEVVGALVASGADDAGATARAGEPGAFRTP
ncbi:MAG: ABC transporter permease [Gemmatimonadaceae bacterium]